jgi:hypothetical protein
MDNRSMWDKLRPLQERMPRAVTETEVLRVAGVLLGDNPMKSAEIARQEVLRWAQKRCGGKLPREAWDFADFDYRAGGRNSAGVRIQSDTSDIWAIRADDPDKTVAGRVWTTEVVVGLGNDDRPRFSARLMVSTSESDMNIVPHSPGFVQQVVETAGLARGEYPISAEPQIIQSEADYLGLSEGLVDDARTLPLIILTVAEKSLNKEVPLVDATALARATVGLARVVILPDEFTWRLTNDFGKKHSVFGGAVRVYLSGFSPDEPPYSHRLIVADRLSDESGRRQCIDMMCQIAASESISNTQINRNILTFAAVRNAALRLQQEQMGDATETEQLVMAKSRVEALEKELEDNETVLNDLATEQVRSIDRAEAAEEQARTAGYRIQQLLIQLKEKGETFPIEESAPETWSQVAKWIDGNLAGLVAISPRARRNSKSPQFGDISLVVRCLTWLAETAHEAFLTGGGSIREAEVETGIRNAHCGGDQFDFDWQGNKYTADWHIKTGGNTRDPVRCLRIYYCWDEVSQQIVIADMPAHRRTGAT